MDAETIIILMVFFFVILPFIGVVTLIAYLVARRRSKLKKDQILERWEVLVENGQGSAEDVYESMISALEPAEAPGVKWERKEIHAGIVEKSYQGMLVTNAKLKWCKIYVFAYDYGTSLHIAWFLTMQMGFMEKALAMSLLKVSDARALIRYLDIPQELELSAYVTTVHGAAKKAVGALMGMLEQDFSSVDTRSKGFLEVW